MNNIFWSVLWVIQSWEQEQIVFLLILKEKVAYLISLGNKYWFKSSVYALEWLRVGVATQPALWLQN